MYTALLHLRFIILYCPYIFQNVCNGDAITILIRAQKEWAGEITREVSKGEKGRERKRKVERGKGGCGSDRGLVKEGSEGWKGFK